MEQREKQLAETDGRVPHQFEVFGVLLSWDTKSDGDCLPRSLELSSSHLTIIWKQKTRMNKSNRTTMRPLGIYLIGICIYRVDVMEMFNWLLRRRTPPLINAYVYHTVSQDHEMEANRNSRHLRFSDDFFMIF